MSVLNQSIHNVLILIIFLICKTLAVSAQSNFLINGNFEDINTCKEYKAECGVEGWFYLKDVKVQMISNEVITGSEGTNAFALFYDWAGYKDFTPVIGTILPCNLKQGQQYIFRGLISAKLNSNLMLKPGVCTGPYFYVPARPFAKEMKPDSIIKIQAVDGTPFFEFEYRFVARGDEQYLTFGTYVNEDSFSAARRLFGKETISLLLDNFSLTSTDPLETYCIAYRYNRQKIYEYDYRHKDMDYTLLAKGKLPVQLTSNIEDNLPRLEVPPLPPARPDTLKLGDVLFDFNKAFLKPVATQMLSAFFKNKDDKRTIDSIYIEGHTDSVGSDLRNMELSQHRCESVKDWLIANDILTSNKMSIHPYGRSRPIASNKTPAGRAINRRVEIVVFKK